MAAAERATGVRRLTNHERTRMRCRGGLGVEWGSSQGSPYSKTKTQTRFDFHVCVDVRVDFHVCVDVDFHFVFMLCFIFVLMLMLIFISC